MPSSYLPVLAALGFALLLGGGILALSSLHPGRLYGSTGTLEMDGIAQALHFGGGLTPATLLGLLLLVAGFSFKLSLVPFHAWAPDAYQGAPSPFRDTGKPHLIDDLAGWGYRYPGLSIALTFCLLSLGGIPPTLGFEAKYLVFVEAIRSGNLWLALVGALTSLIGIFYYLRVVYVLYMKAEVAAPTFPVDFGTRLAALIAAGGVLVLGIFPSWVLDTIDRLVRS